MPEIAPPLLSGEGYDLNIYWKDLSKKAQRWIKKHLKTEELFDTAERNSLIPIAHIFLPE